MITNQELSHDLFLLMLNLSQIQDPAQVRRVFLEAVNSRDTRIRLLFQETAPAGEDPVEEVATTTRSFGYIRFTGDTGALLPGQLSLIRNGIRLLAIILEARHRDLELRREKDDLEQSFVERSNQIFKTALDGIWLIGLDGRVLDANEAYCRMVGYTRDELLAMTVYDLEASHTPEQIADNFRRITTQDGIRFEACHRAKDGHLVPIEVSAKTLEYHGEVQVFCFVRDITERRRAEEEKLNLERQLLHAQKLESLGVLAGGIAHDFNNLLMAILGNADLALHKLSPMAPARSNLEEIERASRRASDLAKQMLAYSGKGRFVVASIDAGELLREMAHLLEVSISKKVGLQYHLQEDLPTFEGDPTQIRQVIMNLITNASEAISEGPGVISLTTGVMTCDRPYLDDSLIVRHPGLDDALPEGSYVFFEVADTGEGMDPSTVERIFDPFFTTKFTGRGLGMSAVMGIVRGHRGALRIYSEPGRGTTVKVLFPTSPRALPPRPDSDEGAADSPEWRGQGTVLVADDEEAVRSVARRMLVHLGFQALEAADGREALAVFRAHQQEITCVLLDLTMPHMDGKEVFREMRRLNPGVKVILCSGYNEQDATQDLSGKGLASFIQKPFQLDVLSQVLQRVLG